MGRGPRPRSRARAAGTKSPPALGTLTPEAVAMAGGESGARRDERGLMARAAGGDQQALVTLLYEYYDRLNAHIRHSLPETLRGALDAQDLLQLTHLKSFRSIHTLRPDSPHGF